MHRTIHNNNKCLYGYKQSHYRCKLECHITFTRQKRWRPIEIIYLSKETYFSDGRIFRKQFPQKLSFSCESQALNVCLSIYLFLVARSFSQCVVNMHAKASNATDHKAIKLSLELLGEKPGPGLWKFNNALVDHEEKVKSIKENYPIKVKKYQDLDDHRLK